MTTIPSRDPGSRAETVSDTCWPGWAWGPLQLREICRTKHTQPQAQPRELVKDVVTSKELWEMVKGQVRRVVVSQVRDVCRWWPLHQGGRGRRWRRPRDTRKGLASERMRASSSFLRQVPNLWSSPGSTEVENSFFYQFYERQYVHSVCDHVQHKTR